MAKKKEVWSQRALAGFSTRAIVLNPATLVLLVTVATIGGTIVLWKDHQAAIVELEDYLLTPEKVVINSLPEQDVERLKTLIVEPDSESEPMTILDPGLVSRTASRLKQVGWIQSVQRVQKSSAGLNIEIECRSPVGLVELNRVTVLNWQSDSDDQLIPVDRFGIILPPEMAVGRPLIRFTIFEPKILPNDEAFSCTADERIQGCAEIASLISERWKEFGFYRITSLRPAGQSNDPKIPFEIWTDTRTATKVIWGNPPGKELSSEASAKVKLAILDQLVAEHGPLNELPPTTIDLRSGTATISRNKTADAAPQSGKLIH